jgi:hypothetical protein
MLLGLHLLLLGKVVVLQAGAWWRVVLWGRWWFCKLVLVVGVIVLAWRVV